MREFGVVNCDEGVTSMKDKGLHTSVGGLCACSLLDVRLDWLHRGLCGMLGLAFRRILGRHIGN